MLHENTKSLATEYLVQELGKLPEVKKISLLQPADDQAVDLAITIARMEHPGKLQESLSSALHRLKTEKGLDVDARAVRLAILEAETRTYSGDLQGSGGNPAVAPIPYFHLDPNSSRVLFRNPPKKKKKKKVEKHDPLWAQAKKLCRLNQEEIRMAKELGMGPRSLMRNIPSPKQQWKLPVKLWIRELYEKRHPGKGFPPEPPPKPIPPLSLEDEEIARRQFEEQMYWEDYQDRNDIGKPKKNAAKERLTPSVPIKPAVTTDPSFVDEIFLDYEDTDKDLPF